MSSGRLRFYHFGDADNPLSHLDSRQAEYLSRYLDDLGARVVLEEPFYFDRDYLDEFSAFYGKSARRYPNHCRRLHFFASQEKKPINRRTFTAALAGNEGMARRFCEAYLGFCVIRPIPSAPFGRTVVRWYPDPQEKTTPRIYPARTYTCHVAGLPLTVDGLAWQQQDSGVGACATIALWSMLHSSAFDDHHAVPTTATITEAAHRALSLGGRTFPSSGLNIYQICEAIKAVGLAPLVISGDVQLADGDHDVRFSRQKFGSSCAALIRSGYPAIVVGRLGSAPHAVCLVGVREVPANPAGPGEIRLQDSSLEYVYIHDDNIGPNIRFGISDCSARVSRQSIVCLNPSGPSPVGGVVGGEPSEVIAGYPTFFPSQLIAATHDGIRTHLDRLHEQSILAAEDLIRAGALLFQAPQQPLGLVVTFKFVKIASYLQHDLKRLLSATPKILARVRCELQEQVEPMSLHVGIARFGVGGIPFMDILFDSTDNNVQMQSFCCVVMQPVAHFLADILLQHHGYPVGKPIMAY